eukprot:483818-Rhodomonas_salina.3
MVSETLFHLLSCTRCVSILETRGVRGGRALIASRCCVNTLTKPLASLHPNPKNDHLARARSLSRPQSRAMQTPAILLPDHRQGCLLTWCGGVRCREEEEEEERGQR